MLGRSVDLAFPDKTALPDDAPVVLSARNLSRPRLVDNVSFDISAGEILGLAGLIGSGRSEVARTIFGADRASGGTVAIDGKPVRIRNPRDAIRAGIVMLPEDRKSQGLLMLRSIADNVVLPSLGEVSRGGVVDTRRERSRVNGLIERVELRTRDVRTKVGALSGGNQQRVLFAKWLLKSPRVFIADEPTRGIDVGAKRAVYQLIHSLSAQGMAVLVISSEHEELLGLAHRVLVMHEGRLVAELEGEAMTEEAVLQAAFGLEGVARGTA
jgi:rhamnose transport system ATP-binding protein